MKSPCGASARSQHALPKDYCLHLLLTGSYD